MNRAAALLLLPGLLFSAPATAGIDDSDDTEFCVLKYGGGGDWYNGLSGVRNFIIEFRRVTGLPIAARERIVSLLDDSLFQNPFLYLNGHGNIVLTDAEVRRLRLYLENGGFLFCNDDYGMDASLRRELKKVFPDTPLTEVPYNHPIYHSWFDFPSGPPKIHEHDGGPARGYGIFVNGRLALYYDAEADIADGWEEEWVHNDPAGTRESALRMGINILIYAMAN